MGHRIRQETFSLHLKGSSLRSLSILNDEQPTPDNSNGWDRLNVFSKVPLPQLLTTSTAWLHDRFPNGHIEPLRNFFCSGGIDSISFVASRNIPSSVYPIADLRVDSRLNIEAERQRTLIKWASASNQGLGQS